MVENYLTPNWDSPPKRPRALYPNLVSDDDESKEEFITCFDNLKKIMNEDELSIDDRLQIFCNLAVGVGKKNTFKLARLVELNMPKLKRRNNLPADAEMLNKRDLFYDIYVRIITHRQDVALLKLIPPYSPITPLLNLSLTAHCPYQAQANLWWDRHFDQMISLYDRMKNKLTGIQLGHFNTITESLARGHVKNNAEFSFCLRGEPGAGKTMLLNLIITHLKLQQPARYIISVGCSPQSANLLLGGQHFPHRFELDGRTNLPPPASSPFAQSLRHAYLIIIDGIQNIATSQFIYLDNLLRDVTGKAEFMGGKYLVTAGDFNQMSAEVLEPRQPYITECESFMRHTIFLDIYNHHRSSSENNRKFRAYLSTEVARKHGRVRLPSYVRHFLSLSKSACASSDLISWVYGQLLYGLYGANDFFKQRTILCREENDAELVNNIVDSKIPEYFNIINSYAEDSRPDCHDAGQLVGPPYHLKLFKGLPLKLTRTYDGEQCLEEGIIVYFHSMPNNNTLIVEHQLTEHKFVQVVIPIMLNKMVSLSKYPPTSFTRKQFPLRPAYARTIEAAEGQQFDVVGIFWNKDTSLQKHGEWFQALSRAKDVRQLAVCLPFIYDPARLYINNTVSAFVHDHENSGSSSSSSSSSSTTSSSSS